MITFQDAQLTQEVQHTRKQTLDLDVVNREIDDILSEIDTQIATEQRELDS